MKATATRESGYRHTVKVRSHDLGVDEHGDEGERHAGQTRRRDENRRHAS